MALKFVGGGAVGDGRVVTLHRGRLPAIDGYIHAEGRRFALVEKISNDLDLDGYAWVRTRDVTRVERSEKAGFYERVLSRRGRVPTPIAGLDLDTALGVLLDVQERFGLVVAHRERVRPDECEVGSLERYRSDAYQLRWLTPQAEWVQDDTAWRLADVTLVEAGGAYETALSVMAGILPAFPAR